MTKNREKSDSITLQLGMTDGISFLLDGFGLHIALSLLLSLILILLPARVLRAMTNKKEESSCKQLEVGGGGGVVDRISNLPDSIIHHILSFLDTKLAVQTCVLSKQWESAWKHVHSLNLQLDFDESLWCHRFVHKVMSLRYPLNVSKVLWRRYGHISADDEFSLLRRLVQYAVSHGAQHFNLQLSNFTEPKLSNMSLFEMFDSISDTVRTLQLDLFHLNFQSECSPFRLLTRLKLQNCWFSAAAGEVVEPFSQFPCLSHLVLFHFRPVCTFGYQRPSTFRVYGLELISLNLTHMHFLKLEIFAPKLVSLSLYIERYMKFPELMLPSLVHADVDGNFRDYQDENYYVNGDSLGSLFDGLRNVEFFTLCCEMSEAVIWCSKFLEQQPCPFKKLNKLNLEFLPKDGMPYKVLENYFLNGCPDAGLNIQIRKERRILEVMIELLH